MRWMILFNEKKQPFVGSFNSAIATVTVNQQTDPNSAQERREN